MGAPLLQLPGKWEQVACAWVWNASLTSSPRPHSSEFEAGCDRRGGGAHGGGPCLVDVAASLANTGCVANPLCSLGDTLMISAEGLAGPAHGPVSPHSSGPDIGPTREETHGDRN